MTSHILSPPSTNDEQEQGNEPQEQGGTVQACRAPKALKLGTGLTFDDTKSRISCTLAGQLIQNSRTNTHYIRSKVKRYLPKLGDRVICIADEQRMGDYYRVTIPGCSASTALLHSWIGFEGATKRNRPNLAPGTLLYARISVCNIAVMEPEVSCTVLPGEERGGAVRRDWMTDEGTYGELKGGGSCIQVSLGLARELLTPDCVILDALGNTSRIPFEICIGVNGILWVNSHRAEYTILILNAIKNSEIMTESQTRGMVKALLKTVQLMIEDEE